MKKIIKNFNNIIERTIFKVQNKTNNNLNISSFNKYLITFIATLFVYLFYLLTPLLYDKTWIQTKIESKLLSEFRINLSTTADISYRILPAPHFLIRDSKILVEEGEKIKKLAEIKDLKVFLSQRNLFDKNKLSIKKLVISDANFFLFRSDFKLLNEFKKKKLSNNKIKINNSDLFFKNNLGEIISIIKIEKITAFYDNQKLMNFFNSKGEVFNIPFNFNFLYQNNSTEYEEIDFKSKSLKLNFFNKSIKKNNIIHGENSISFLNSIINTKYNLKEKLITFKSDGSKIHNSHVSYTGELTINPFDLNLNINLDNHKISKLFNINLILIEFIKSGLLFNDNISVKNSIIISSKEKNDFFQTVKINFNIVNGEVNFDKTIFVNNNIGLLELNNSNLFLENESLILNTDIFFNVKNSDNLFSFLNTNKKSRKEFKNILFNLDYNFLKNDIKFNNVKIDNKEVSEQFLNLIQNLDINNLNNTVKNRRLINKLLNIYEG